MTNVTDSSVDHWLIDLEPSSVRWGDRFAVMTGRRHRSAMSGTLCSFEGCGLAPSAPPPVTGAGCSG